LTRGIRIIIIILILIRITIIIGGVIGIGVIGLGDGVEDCPEEDADGEVGGSNYLGVFAHGLWVLPS